MNNKMSMTNLQKTEPNPLFSAFICQFSCTEIQLLNQNIITSKMEAQLRSISRLIYNVKDMQNEVNTKIKDTGSIPEGMMLVSSGIPFENLISLFWMQ